MSPQLYCLISTAQPDQQTTPCKLTLCSPLLLAVWPSGCPFPTQLSLLQKDNAQGCHITPITKTCTCQLRSGATPLSHHVMNVLLLTVSHKEEAMTPFTRPTQHCSLSPAPRPVNPVHICLQTTFLFLSYFKELQQLLEQQRLQ